MLNMENDSTTVAGGAEEPFEAVIDAEPSEPEPVSIETDGPRTRSTCTPPDPVSIMSAPSSHFGRASVQTRPSEPNG